MIKVRIALAISAMFLVLFSSAATASADTAPSVTEDTPCCAKP